MVADIQIDYHGNGGELYDREDIAYADRIVLAVEMALYLKVCLYLILYMYPSIWLG